MHPVWFQMGTKDATWHWLQLPVPTCCPEAHLFMALRVATSALKWHDAARLQILSIWAFSLKVYLLLDWQCVTAEPSEHGASLRMVSELVLTSLKSQVTAAVLSVLWLMVNLHTLVGWHWDSVVCWSQSPSSLSFRSNLTEGAQKKMGWEFIFPKGLFLELM